MAELLTAARSQFLGVGYQATTMEAIAARAGVSKRTLYLWHADKAALFRACVLDGAERFPLPAIDAALQPEEALARYAAEIVRDLSTGQRYAMGLLLMREGRDFPELGPTIEQIEGRYMTLPVSAYLLARGLLADDVAERAQLFLSMALSESNHRMMLGMPPPDGPSIERHARLIAEVFLRGHRLAGDARRVSGRS
jgi:TetR/AcrR family transcriptional repressor of mexJK operon